MLNIPYIVKNADSLWKKIRWSATNGIPTCSCGCQDTYKLSDGRYKCKECGKIFSDRTGTLLHHSKLSVEIWLIALFKFANISECSAIDLQKECGVNYKTAYMMLQKLRYLVGKQELSLSGICRVDEAYIGAEWKNVHFNKKMSYMRDNGFLEKDSKRYTKHQLLSAVSAKKFHIVSLTDENNITRIIHTPNPIDKRIIESIIFDKKNNITELVTDESNLYKYIGIPVHQSNHSKHIFMTEEGFTSNIAENRFSWVKRKWNGVFTHTSEKYLQLYLNQRQFNHNNTGKSVEERFFTLMGLCTTNTITCREVFNFDYKASFPKSKRKQQEEYCKTLKEEYGTFISSITDNYHRTY